MLVISILPFDCFESKRIGALSLQKTKPSASRGVVLSLSKDVDGRRIPGETMRRSREYNDDSAYSSAVAAESW